MAHDLSLEPILQAAEPRLWLVRERYLRQVIDYLRDSGRKIPLNLSLPFWISRKDLEAANIRTLRSMPKNGPLLLLITDPQDRSLSELPKDEQLLAYWRLLFQASVMQEIDRKTEAGLLNEAKCQEKLSRFGEAVEREITFVINSETLVVEDADPIAIYRAFAAAYLDFKSFEKHRLEEFFPSLPAGNAVDAMLAEDLDCTALLNGCRPAGVAPPHQEASPDVAWFTPDCLPETPISSPAELAACPSEAVEAAKKGNFVRAAILHTKLVASADAADLERIRCEAFAELNKVISALGDLFAWDEATRQEWGQAVLPLLESATAGFWPRAARCLYELQRIPADFSREVYTVDLAESIRTFGRRPLKRLLTRARPVLLLMHLKKAQAQMLRAGLDHAAQFRLDRLFQHQIHSLETTIRRDFTPVIGEVLNRAGLVPRTTVETVGRDKLVAELLDRVCERGYLRLADLRDAVARNRLKLSDIHTVADWLIGDAMLRADVDMSYAFDGVYRKGEIYLRLLQRFSALFFGTRFGRLITIYLVIPFGGAFLSLMFAHEVHLVVTDVWSLIARKTAKPVATSPNNEQTAAADERIQQHQVEVDHETGEVYWVPSEVVTSEEVDVTEGGELEWIDSTAQARVATQIFTSSATTTSEAKKDTSILIAWPTILGFGFFLLLTIHVPPFRRVVFWILGYVWWAVRGVLWDIPAKVWQSSFMRRFRQSYIVRFLVRNFWSPTIVTLLLFPVLVLIGFRPWFLIRWGWVPWALLSAIYPIWGWHIQDKIAESVTGLGRYIRKDLIPGFLGVILGWISLLGNWIERQLYAVDEWLRFRGGDSQGSLVLKAILGLLWFPLAYMFRFAFYLLLEPQINPVKHFPVVTVSHKVIWPMLGEIVKWTGLSKWTVAAFINGIPGIFGFIAWELRENWRLYQANIPPRLKPVIIGSHGETMRRLLRPGFHSGTIPKVFRKLRHADPGKASRFHHDLKHLAVSVEQFAARELIDLLHRCPAWGSIAVEVEAIHFGCQRITIELAATGLGRDHFTISLENVNERVEARVEQMGWVDKLTIQQNALLVRALRGLMDMAAAEIINGKQRVEGTTSLGPGFDDLARTVASTEWVECWNRDSARG